jgi:RNA polymerase sporulation-specific sigma factor
MDAEQVAESYKNMVHSISQKIIRQYSNLSESCGMTYEDVAQVGFVGLFKAHKKFKPELGYQFTTYAYPMVEGEIRRFIRDHHNVKVSRRALYAYYKIARNSMFNLTPEEIEEQLGIPARVAKEAKGFHLNTISMDSVVFENDGDPITLKDQLVDEDGLEDYVVDNVLVQEFLNSLNDRERLIWHLRNKKHMSQIEVGKALGISQVQVSRLEKKIEFKAEQFGKRKGVRK